MDSPCPRPVDFHLDVNELTGSMPDEVCALTVEADLRSVRVDCEEVFCYCCDDCEGSFPTKAPTTSVSTEVENILTPALPVYSLSAILAAGFPQNDALNWLVESPGILDYSDEEIRERYALAVLYYSTRESLASVSNWMTQETICDWQGVACNENGFVSTIELVDKGLPGGVEPDISILTQASEYTAELRVMVVLMCVGRGGVVVHRVAYGIVSHSHTHARTAWIAFVPSAFAIRHRGVGFGGEQSRWPYPNGDFPNGHSWYVYRIG